MNQDDFINLGIALGLGLLAGLSNLVFKGGMAAAIGDARPRKLRAVVFGGAVLAGLGIIWLWPVG